MSVSSRMQAAKSTAARLSVTLTLRPGRCASRKTNSLTVPLCLYSQSERLIWASLAGIGGRTSPMSWVGFSSKQTTGRPASRFGVAAVWWNVGAYTTAYAWREIDTDNGIKLCHCSLCAIGDGDVAANASERRRRVHRRAACWKRNVGNVQLIPV